MRGRFSFGRLGAVDMSGCLLSACFQDMGVGGLSVIFRTISFHDLQRISRADVKAGAHSVAKDLFHQDGLVLVVQLERTFHAGRRTQPAAIAFIAVYLNDLSFSHVSSPY